MLSRSHIILAVLASVPVPHTPYQITTSAMYSALDGPLSFIRSSSAANHLSLSCYLIHHKIHWKAWDMVSVSKETDIMSRTGNESKWNRLTLVELLKLLRSLSYALLGGSKREYCGVKAKILWMPESDVEQPDGGKMFLNARGRFAKDQNIPQCQRPRVSLLVYISSYIKTHNPLKDPNLLLSGRSNMASREERLFSWRSPW